MPGDDDAPAFVAVLACHLHPQSAVDEQHLARDERGLVGAEEPYRPGDVLRIAEAAERRVLRASAPCASSGITSVSRVFT